MHIYLDGDFYKFVSISFLDNVFLAINFVNNFRFYSLKARQKNTDIVGVF